MDYYEYYEALIPSETQRYNFFYMRLNKMLLEWNKFIYQNEHKTENSWVYLFEYIKSSIIDILSEFCPREEKKILKSRIWDDNFKEILFKNLIKYKKKSLIIWCFLQCNYYINQHIEKKMYNEELIKNMDFIISKGSFFENVDELYLDPLLVISAPLFSLSYRNQNNKELFQKRYDTYISMCPDILYNGVADRTISQDGKLKIGFMSDFLTKDSSVLRDRMGIIENLDSNLFDIHLIISIEPENIKGTLSKEFYERNKDKFLILDRTIQKSREQISELNLDVLVFCEIGMAVKNLLLSFSRMAPVQINTWGHSDTSGHKDIDYYISSKIFETEDAQDNYSEKLIKFDSLGTYYFSPEKQFLGNIEKDDKDEEIIFDRKYFSLPEDKILIGCIQSKFKISIEFENILKNILENNSNCLIYLSIFTEINRSHLNRIKEKLGDNFEKLQFIKGMNTDRYLKLLKNFDFMLDPYPFGGCNTSLEAFDFNIPVVTQPTDFINGRFTNGFYQLMDIEGLSAKNEEEYSEIVTKLINDPEYLQEIKLKIKDNKYKLFEQNNSITDWSEFLLGLRNK
jgi:protein O-GlcNAc transferase